MILKSSSSFTRKTLCAGTFQSISMLDVRKGQYEEWRIIEDVSRWICQVSNFSLSKISKNHQIDLGLVD